IDSYAYFFFQAEDGIRDFHVTGVQTCALPILLGVPDEVHERVTGWRPLTDVVEAKRSTITPAGCTSTSSTTWKPVALVAMARKVTGKRFGRKVSLPERARGAGLYAMRSCWKLPPS